MDIQELINRLRSIADSLFLENYNIYDNIMQVLPEIETNYKEFISLIPALNEIGMDIDSDQVVRELTSITDVLKNQDKVALSDLLYYEMPNTLSIYEEIKKIMAE